jgi:hypothetical protein
MELEGPPQRLPFHPSIPKENVFADKDVRNPERLTTILENFLLTGVRRAQMFRPRPNDVILVSGPCSGEDVAGRVLATLVADNPKQLSKHDDVWTLPWIESRYIDERPEDIIDPFFSSKVRVLRTQMAMTMLNPRQHKGPKYVALVRHPLDLRAAFYKYMRNCYNVRSDLAPKLEFDDVFVSADSFVNVPVTLCQMSTIDAASYEQFVYDWYRESRINPDVLIVFYESLISNPRREIRRILSFLQNTVNDASASRRKKGNGPAFQGSEMAIDEERVNAAMIAGRFYSRSASSAGSAKRLTSTLRRMSMAIKQKARSMSKRSGSSSSGGSFMNDGDGGEGMGGSVYENVVSIRTIQQYWEQRMGGLPLTYEKMYEIDMNETYPFPQVSLPKHSQSTQQINPFQTKLESVGRVMSSARIRITNVVKGDMVEKLKAANPVSALKPSRFMNKSEEPDDEKRDVHNPRDYAGSMLPSQAFSNADWVATSTNSNPLFNANKNDMEDETDTDSDEKSQARSHNTSQLSSGEQPPVTSYSVANKFVSQEVMEVNMLRSSMRLAGVNKAIVDVVAVKPNELSEML